jgi:hypothetical protein
MSVDDQPSSSVVITIKDLNKFITAMHRAVSVFKQVALLVLNDVMVR